MIEILVALGAVLLLVLGEWGRRNAQNLAPYRMEVAEQEHQARVLRRGGVTCEVVAVIFLLSVLLGLW